MYNIQILPKAIKQLKKIDKTISKKIYSELYLLEKFPDCKNVKKLENHQYQYRLRIGQYRVLFDIVNKEIKIILIQEVRKRDERTY